jgi:N-acetylmuramoyl-L-alanine amidase
VEEDRAARGRWVRRIAPSLALAGLARGLALAAVACPHAGAAETREPAAAPSERFDTVVLDPGHGGDDEGARGPGGLLEKDLTLDVARRLGRALRAQGLAVVLTRDRDRFVGLDERTAIANDARADLFVSIHANGSEARAARGVETFFASLEASDEAAARIAREENQAFARGVAAAAADPLVLILGDMIATEHLFESQEFARFALRELAAADGEHSRGVKQAPFVVLMGVRMPAALVEIGFVTNAREEQALSRPEERDRVALGLARAVRAFGERHDAKRGAAGGARGGREARAESEAGAASGQERGGRHAR